MYVALDYIYIYFAFISSQVFCFSNIVCIMGKIGGSSWLSAVKRAFRSPSKENDKRSSRRREDHEQEEEEKVKIFFLISNSFVIQ